MLEPLDPMKLRAVASDKESADSIEIRSAKRFFAIDEVLEGVRSLLSAFWQFRPHLYHDHKNRKKWHIQFPVLIPLPRKVQLLTSKPGTPV